MKQVELSEWNAILPQTERLRPEWGERQPVWKLLETGSGPRRQGPAVLARQGGVAQKASSSRRHRQDRIPEGCLPSGTPSAPKSTFFPNDRRLPPGRNRGRPMPVEGRASNDERLETNSDASPMTQPTTSLQSEQPELSRGTPYPRRGPLYTDRFTRQAQLDP